MIRIVLAGWSPDDWRVYRQPRWIGEVRKRPGATNLPRRHFDMEEDSYRACLREWGAEGRKDLASALDLLARHGAIEVHRT